VAYGRHSSRRSIVDYLLSYVCTTAHSNYVYRQRLSAVSRPTALCCYLRTLTTGGRPFLPLSRNPGR
jgi:hypothetical protein